ncbi:hypothetical protein SAMD00023353_2601560 [Rosellinia necatrix]|uniref:Uncharacterized protein n=1 Tax=Rosellinia necatrix TaxID=77044 RepID=A0A1W2TH29_ROSNE|nr:hypothetical protein SAMD00023353_2601560 [Rosellinia necatrix]
MHSPPPPENTKKARRVSFAVPNSSNTAKTRLGAQPKSSSKATVDDDNDGGSSSNNSNDTHPAPSQVSPASISASPARQTTSVPIDDPAGIFTHTVTNTPHGLVIDGVLRPRGPAPHSNPRDVHSQYHPQYQSQPNWAYNQPLLSNFQQPVQPPQPNMSTVGAGLMPDPNAVHYQPPVPDTTHGPFQHTYVPRADTAGPQYMMANGAPPAGGPQFYAPSVFPYQQPQPGIATAPIPMVPPGHQPPPFMQGPPMQAYPMQGPAMNVQPGLVPAMACAPQPGGPAYMATGIGQPPPANSFFVSGPGGVSGIEMGKTKTEIDAETQCNAMRNQMNEPQNAKPSDDDISRMYWCRELDGQWVSRSRYSLDRMGNFRWYITDNGVFYAKMLPE